MNYYKQRVSLALKSEILHEKKTHDQIYCRENKCQIYYETFKS